MEWKHDKIMYEPLFSSLHPKRKHPLPLISRFELCCTAASVWLSLKILTPFDPHKIENLEGPLSFPLEDMTADSIIKSETRDNSKTPDLILLFSKSYMETLLSCCVCSRNKCSSHSLPPASIPLFWSSFLRSPFRSSFSSGPWFLPVNPTSLQNRQVRETLDPTKQCNIRQKLPYHKTHNPTK